MDGVYFLSILVLIANIATLLIGAILFLGIGAVRGIGVFRNTILKFMQIYALQILLLIS
ncbi:MAG: hypothetical protein US75_C0017G0001, partial [Candidatus Woesebacteria bacterium GW2011_GWC1_38_13]